MEPRGAQQSRWTGAGFLKAGDRVPSAKGGLLAVVAAEVDRRPTRVYNLEVAADHTYAAGELQAWVHNAAKTSSPGRMQRDVERGRAPKEIERVDKGKGPHEKDHVHIKNCGALNVDGTWKHGGDKPIPKRVRKWLEKHGWTAPK